MKNLLVVIAMTIGVIVQSQTDWNYVSHINSSLVITDKYTGYYHYFEELGSHGFVYYLKKSIDGMSTFSTIRSNSGMFACCTLDAIYFCDNDIGFFAELDQGSSMVYRTVNGGLTWQNLGLGGFFSNRLYFLNQDFGFLSFKLPPGTSLLLRYDYGNDTIIMNTPDYDLSAFTTKIYFLDTATGFIITTNNLNHGVILKTTDSGDNWYEVNINENNTFRDIYFVSDSTGFVIGSNGLILKTNNIGENWIEVSINYSETLNSISFFDAFNGYIVGGNGLILKSSDGGNLWNSVDFVNSDSLIYTKSVGTEACYVLSGNGNLYRNFNLTETNEISNNKINVSPNPFNKDIKIEIKPDYRNIKIEGAKFD